MVVILQGGAWRKKEEIISSGKRGKRVKDMMGLMGQQKWGRGRERKTNWGVAKVAGLSVSSLKMVENDEKEVSTV